MKKTSTILALAILATLSTNSNAMNLSKEKLVKTVSTNGTCIAKVKNDKIKVSIKISSFDKESSQTALEKTKLKNKEIEQYIKSLQATGLELDTNNISVFEDKYWDNKSNKYNRNGFKAEITLDVIIPMSKQHLTGDIISKATTYDKVSINSFYTYISTKKMEDAKLACLGDAVKNAKVKANKIASAAGLKVVSMISANNNATVSSPRPYYMDGAAAMTMAKSSRIEDSAPININSKDEEVRVNISTTWEIK